MRAKAILRFKDPDETNARAHDFHYYTPEDVMPGVKDRKALETALKWYANPFIRKHTPDSTFARRRYVEKVRPTLRWYCKKFGVNVPAWLKGNGHYDKLGPEEHEAFFGKDPLDVREFEEQRMEGKDDAAQ